MPYKMKIFCLGLFQFTPRLMYIQTFANQSPLNTSNWLNSLKTTLEYDDIKVLMVQFQFDSREIGTRSMEV